MFQIPPELRVALAGLFTFLVTAGLKALAALIGKDFSGGIAALVAVIVGAMLFFIDGLVVLIPLEYQDVAAAVFGLALAILSAFGIHYTRKNP